MRLSLPAASFATIAASLALAACGDDKPSTSESEEREASSPATALREVGETRDALRAALATYTGGDHAAAEDQVAEAYLSHFEHVEGALGRRDEHLNEELEEAISRDLRADMKRGAPDAEVAAAVKDIVADLAKAEALLR